MAEKYKRLTFEERVKIENILNNRPRKVLGFRTPNEMRTMEIQKYQSIQNPISEITFG